MFFDNLNEIPTIAGRTGTAIFILPSSSEFGIKNALTLEPQEKSVITIDQVRDVLSKLSVKQSTDQYIIIRPADKMNDEAANALLKNLEEPGDKLHFILITDSPSKLLPTILSRASIYFLRDNTRTNDILADQKIKDLAKKLITARPKDLPAIAEEITKKKDGVRNYALNILGTAIEMLYKSYYITGKSAFISKLPKFLNTYENIEKNGHIKLHLVADLC